MGILNKFFREGRRYSYKNGTICDTITQINDSLVEIRDKNGKLIEIVEIADHINKTYHYNEKGELSRIGYYDEYFKKLEIQEVGSIDIKEVMEKGNHVIETRDYYGYTPKIISEPYYDDWDDEWDDEW